MLDTIFKSGSERRQAHEDLRSLVEQAREERSALEIMLARVNAAGPGLVQTTRSLDELGAKTDTVVRRCDQLGKTVGRYDECVSAFEKLETRMTDLLAQVADARQHAEALSAPDGGLQQIRALADEMGSQRRDARAALDELLSLLEGYAVESAYRARAADYNREWDAEVERIYHLEHGPLISQGEVIGVVNMLSRPQDVLLCAAGSLPGDLHKLWRTRDPKGYHLEYGYSCMGYEIAGGLGVKMAAPERDVYVMVGDGSYLMLNSEIVTMVQEGLKVIVVVLDNHGFASIGGLSKSVGSDGFGTKYRRRTKDDELAGDVLPVDYAANAASLGAHVIRASSRDELADALQAAQRHEGGPVCIVVETDRSQRVGGYESWWDVAVAEVSASADVEASRREYEEAKRNERYFL